MADTTPKTKVEVQELTEVSLTGGGIFDQLMQATKLHLQEEFDAGRIRGTEYASVYTQSLDTVMQQSIVFLLAQEKTIWENKILEGQVHKLEVEADLIVQQNNKTAQEVLNLAAEFDLIAKQGHKLDAEVDLIEQQSTKTAQEVLNLEAEAGLIAKQVIKLDAETDLITKQGNKIAQEVTNLAAEFDLIAKQAHKLDVESALIEQQTCKLKAEFDLIEQQISKTAQETQLLTQKKITEEAQVSENVADPASVLGRQIALYRAQTEGFQRDAEQKAARIFADAVAVTDGIEGEGSFNLAAGGINNALNYNNLNLVVDKLLGGINANSTE